MNAGKKTFAAFLFGAFFALQSQAQTPSVEFSPPQQEAIRRIVAAELAIQRETVRNDIFRELGLIDPAARPAILPAQGGSQSEPAQRADETVNSRTFLRDAAGRKPLPSLFDDSIAPAASGFELNSSTESSRASIRFARETSGALGRFSSTTWTASAPLDKGDSDFTNIATLDGLANSFELGFAHTFFAIDGIRRPFDANGVFSAEYLALCKLAELDISDPGKNCKRRAINDRFVAAGRNDLVAQLDELYRAPDTRRQAFGFKASVGRDAYDYFVPATLAKESDTRVPWSLGTYYGFVPSGSHLFLGAGLAFQRSYSAAKARVVCPPFVDTAGVTCINGNIGGPERKDKHLVYAEARGYLNGKAFALKVTRDFRNDETGVDLPIYLVQNDAGLLNGGVRLGWTNTDQFSIGIFVGTTFGFYPTN